MFGLSTTGFISRKAFTMIINDPVWIPVLSTSEIWNISNVVYGFRHIQSGKIYVGKTERTLAERHGLCLKKLGFCTVYFRNAVKKHGRENFEVAILGSGPISELNEMEVHFIATLKTFDSRFGYNLTKGGEGISGYHHTEQALSTLRRKNTEYFQDPEKRKVQSDRIKRYFADPEVRVRQSKIIKSSKAAKGALQVIHEKMKSTVLVTRGSLTERIPQTSLNSYLQEGWKRGTSLRGTGVLVNREGKLKKILKEELDSYLSRGWTRGNLLSYTPEMRLKQKEIAIKQWNAEARRKKSEQMKEKSAHKEAALCSISCLRLY
jgi:group I intron endonuclease